jgi:DNA-binding MarR family transcriptional regulator
MLATTIDPAERRKHITRPTTKGRKIVQAAQETLAQFYAPLLEGFSAKENEQLFRMLVRLHDYCCAAGKPMACDHQTAIGELYAYQKGQ